MSARLARQFLAVHKHRVSSRAVAAAAVYRVGNATFKRSAGAHVLPHKTIIPTATFEARWETLI